MNVITTSADIKWRQDWPIMIKSFSEQGDQEHSGKVKLKNSYQQSLVLIINLNA